MTYNNRDGHLPISRQQVTDRLLFPRFPYYGPLACYRRLENA